MTDLCRRYSALSEKETKRDLKGNLPEKRYAHSLNVAERAVELAVRYGADPDKAWYAGLVHDSAKGFSHERQREMIEGAGIALDPDQEESPKIWHAIAGAVYIRDRYGVTDPDIINAVRYHTTGRAGMSILEKVIYMADLTSAERDYPDADYTRRLTDLSLDQGIAYGVRYVVKSLESAGKPRGRDTEALMKEYEDTEITLSREDR